MNFNRRHLAAVSRTRRNAIWWLKRQLLKMDKFGQSQIRANSDKVGIVFLPINTRPVHQTTSVPHLRATDTTPSDPNNFRLEIHEMGTAMMTWNASQVSAWQSSCWNQTPFLVNEDPQVRIFRNRDGAMRIDHQMGHVRVDNQRSVRATFKLGDR